MSAANSAPMSVRAADTTSDPLVPRIPVGEWIDSGFVWVNTNLGDFFDVVSDSIQTTIGGLEDLLNVPSPLLMVVILSVIALVVAGWKVSLASLIGLTLVIGMDQWENAMVTLALVLASTVVALLIGIPIGVLAATSDRFSRIVRPVMDLMQTMPAFVWLVPVVTLFSIGVPAGLVATVIFALPPGVRMTELGIRQVDAEVVEAGHAFGGTRRQILGGIQLPLAMPTVMAGINQVIMLSLSMAVIAGLVGAGGLGGAVTSSIARLDIGLGFEAGLAVVALAIYLDRVTAAISAPRRKGRFSLSRLVARRKESAPPVGSAA